MPVTPYDAADLFEWLTTKEDFLLLDVRNDEEFGRFKVEGPYPIDMVNVPFGPVFVDVKPSKAMGRVLLTANT